VYELASKQLGSLLPRLPEGEQAGWAPGVWEAVPEHGEKELAPLQRLMLDPATTLFLGLIHGSDGLKGARRRIEAASTAVAEFGIGHYCGLGYHEGTAASAPQAYSLHMSRPEMLDLHRRVAEE
jgi:hypothetical protein